MVSPKDTKFARTYLALPHQLRNLAESQTLFSQPGGRGLRRPQPALPGEDAEEIAADRFAVYEVLDRYPFACCVPEDGVQRKGTCPGFLGGRNRTRIEPGTLALCFGYSTGDWPTANAAIRRIHPQRQAVWAEINHLALHELSLDQLPEEASLYVRAVLRGAATKWTP